MDDETPNNELMDEIELCEIIEGSEQDSSLLAQVMAAGNEAAKHASAAKATVGEAAISVAENVSEAVIVASGVLAEKVGAIGDVAGETLHELRLRKYAPLFPEEYFSPQFDRPKVIVIEDEDKRKNIDVCEGAIGWMSIRLKPEVMHLYEEAVELSGLSFSPRPICNAVYLRDQFDNEHYLEITSYIQTGKQDQMTELKLIARKLGARECRLECYEEVVLKADARSRSDIKSSVPIEESLKQKATVGGGSELASNYSKNSNIKILFTEKFTGSDNPERPELKWYKTNKEIKNLIESRCDENNTMTEYSCDVSSTSQLAMTQSYARDIDASIGSAGAKGKFSLEAEFEREARKRLVYIVKF